VNTRAGTNKISGSSQEHGLLIGYPARSLAMSTELSVLLFEQK